MPREFSSKYSEGHDVEEGVLGRVERGARMSHKEYLEKKERGELPDITDEQAWDIVERYQPFEDPSNPKEKPFPKAALFDVAHRLNISHKQLRYYTAVESLLDYRKKDASFNLLLENGKILRVTLDITLDEEKLASKQADVPFLWTAHKFDKNDPEEQNLYKIHFNKSLEDVSADVFNVFKGKAEERGLIIRSLSLEEIQRSEKSARQEQEKRSLRLPRQRLLRRRTYAR